MRPSSSGSKTIAAPAAMSTAARSVLAVRDGDSAAPRTQRHPAPGSTAGSATDAIAARSAPPRAAMSAALRRSPKRALQTARMASRSASSSRFAACAACAATNSPRPATTAATSSPPPAIARPTCTSAPRRPPASSAAPSAATRAATTSGQRQLARLTSTWAAVSSNPFGSSRSTGTVRFWGMRRATVGATRRIPSKSVPSLIGRPKLNDVSPRTSARWRDASARCTTRRNTGESATADTSGTRSGRTTSAFGTALLVSPVTIWSATTRRTSASPSEEVTRVANSSSSTSVVSAYHAIAAPASSRAVRTTMRRAAARRMPGTLAGSPCSSGRVRPAV